MFHVHKNLLENINIMYRSVSEYRKAHKISNFLIMIEEKLKMY